MEMVFIFQLDPTNIYAWVQSLDDELDPYFSGRLDRLAIELSRFEFPAAQGRNDHIVYFFGTA